VRRRHPGEEGDATPDLLLRYPDAILAKYKKRQIKHLKYVFKTLKKHVKKHLKIIATIRNIHIKYLHHTCETYATSR
jgi:hypothetical protein